METRKNEVGFFNSVKAKLILMGVVSVASVCVLCGIMLKIISRINNYAQFTGQINKINQFQAENNALKTTYYYSMDDELLNQMADNLKDSQHVAASSKKLATGKNKEAFQKVEDDINTSLNNLNEIIKLSEQRGFTQNKALYAEFIKNDNTASNLFTTKTKEDSWVDISINSFTNYFTKNVVINNVSYSAYKYSGALPKKGKRQSLVIRLGGQGVDFNGKLYINNINFIKKDGTQEVYDLQKLMNEDLNTSYGTALRGYELKTFDGKVSIVVDMQCVASSGTWQDSEICVPIGDMELDEYSKITYEVYAQQNLKADQLSLGAAVQGKVDFMTVYQMLNNYFLAYTRHVANGDDVTSELQNVNDLLKQLTLDIKSYVPDAKTNKQLANIINDKQNVFNQICDNDQSILEYKKQNAKIDEDLSYTTMTLKDNIDQAMANSKRLATIITIVVLLIIVVAIALTTLVISRNIDKSLDEFGNMLDEVAKGNLRVRTHLNSKDEFGVFSKQMNSFVDRMSNVLAHIQLLINEVTNKNLVVANTMKQVAKGDMEDYDVIDEGILYLKKLSDEVAESVMTQGANTEESLAALNEQVQVNTTILGKVENIKEFSAKTFGKVMEIQKHVETLTSAMKAIDENDSHEMEKLSSEMGQLTRNLAVQMAAITSMTAQNSKDMDGLLNAVRKQNISFKGIADAIEQISNEAMEILDRAQTTNRVAGDISKELIDGVETIDEIITSSEELRGDIAYFKIEDEDDN